MNHRGFANHWPTKIPLKNSWEDHIFSLLICCNTLSSTPKNGFAAPYHHRDRFPSSIHLFCTCSQFLYGPKDRNKGQLDIIWTWVRDFKKTKVLTSKYPLTTKESSIFIFKKASSSKKNHYLRASKKYVCHFQNVLVHYTNTK